MTIQPHESSPAIEVRDVAAGYGRREVLRGLSMQIHRGEVYSLVGRNGSGKTTLIASLMGFRPVSRGSVRVFGADPWRQRARLCAEIGFAPENPEAPPDLSVARIAAFCASLYPKWNERELATRLRRLAIPMGARFGALSRGQSGLVSLALALAPSPTLCIFDDPTLGFDAVAKSAFYDELIGDLADRHTTVFMATHDLAEVERVADRVAILHDGRIAEEGSLDEIQERHRSADLATSSLPSLEDVLRDLTAPLEVER